MIVTTGARDGQSEKRLPDDIDLIVDGVALPQSANVDRGLFSLPEPPEGRSLDRFVGSVARIAARRREQVAREVLGDECVVGEIVIEGTHHVVAIRPDSRNVEVEFVPIRFREAHEIEPVTSPSHTVIRRRKEPLDDPLKCGWRVVAKKRVDVASRRAEARLNRTSLAGAGCGDPLGQRRAAVPASPQPDATMKTVDRVAAAQTSSRAARGGANLSRRG